ncbi:transcriptional regulator, HxlR family [Devosia sp. YR412]|uniref:winged helix-turn-helix transcriptional regulator n=1 Tax=Devosia sp. YR412 TaxID=1881030 RepID=UPI0008CCF0CF|nr:helix-turn-helix domain-containing protein [Devosia sp. YR412]SEP99234.1 transcriptional regulator, HxlR family [Devosia sp. YR412]
MKPAEPHIHNDCRPVGEILHQIAGKWTVLIINLLSGGPLRFSEIKKQIGGISQKVLTATLRELEMDGFVTRTVTPSIPPRVDYELTELGYDLQKPLKILGAWAVDNRPRVLEARGRYFMAHPEAKPQPKGKVAHRPLMQAAE